MENNPSAEGKLVVLVPAPFHGHITPMLHLATALHSKGFSILIAHTKFNSPDPSLNLHFTFLPLPDHNLSNILRSKDVFAFMKAADLNCKLPLKQSLIQSMKERSPGNQICCIIYDSFMSFSEAVANDMNIPCILLRTSSAMALLVYNNLPRLHSEGYLPIQDSKKLDLFPGLHTLRVKDLDLGFGTLEFSLKICEIVKNIRTSAAIILNSNDYLEQFAASQLKELYQVPIFMIGPLHKIAPTSFCSSEHTVDTSCISWLDKQAPKSVIYVSLGSFVTIDKKDLVEMAWGLANSNQPFLWVIRPGFVEGSEWIDDLLPEDFKEKVGERGYIVNWAPQTEVLTHDAIGGFWSHCGWNSTLESISEGVPIICNPFIADQLVNTRYLVYDWKVGLEFNYGMKRLEIEKAIRTLMQDKVGKEITERAIEMKERLKISTSNNGSANNSLNSLTEFILSFSCHTT